MGKHIVFIDDASTFGGAQIALCNALEVLSKEGEARLSAIVSKGNKMLIDRVRQINGVSVIECPPTYPANLFLFFLRLPAFGRILRLDELRDVDHWIINLSGIEFGLATVFLLKRKQKHIYGWLHNTQQLTKLMPSAGTIKKAFYFIRDAIADRFIFTIYDKLIVPSQAAKETLCLRAHQLPLVHILYNFPKMAAHILMGNSNVKPILPAQKSPAIVVVGRIEFSTKGQDRAIGIALALRQRGLSPFFIFIGDGRDADELRNSFHAAGLQDIYRIVGWQADVPSWLHEVSVVLIPSRFESFSLVAAEAMALNKKIVSSTLPCFDEVLPQVCRASSDSADDFADAIVHMLDLKDEELATLYAPYLEKFSPDAFLRTFHALLENEVEHAA